MRLAAAVLLFLPALHAQSTSPRHWAVVAHHADAAKALQDAGAEVNAVDRFGYTPLLYAATIDFGDAETVTALLRGGADPQIKDNKGETPLAHARQLPYVSAVLENAGATKD